MKAESKNELRIAIASNFTANEIISPLRHWLEVLTINHSITLCSHDSIIQQLLGPYSDFSEADIALVFLSIENWCSTEPKSASSNSMNFDSLLEAVSSARQRFSSLYIILISSPLSENNRFDDYLYSVDQALENSLAGLAGITYISSEAMNKLYAPVEYGEYFTYGASVPGNNCYSELCFATLATMAARRIRADFHPGSKVVVVDCDNTLWSGICAESSTAGLSVSPGNRALQELLVKQVQYGRLLCLCSKNFAPDVTAVFESNTDMRLKLQHITSSRINWESKVSNIESLSKELSIGLEEFVFLDDAEHECASVRAELPSVRCHCLPRDSNDLEYYLQHIWELDARSITLEDTQRILYYQKGKERDQLQKTSPSLEAFLQSLQLQVIIDRVNAHELPRLAQLAQRVNQFTLNGTRLLPSQLETFQIENVCRTIYAKDRFGDYGLVGFIVYRSSRQILLVEHLALSCRALGKGVEDRIFEYLSEEASCRRCSELRFHFRQTVRNIPILKWLNELEAVCASRGNTIKIFSTSEADPYVYADQD